MSVYEMSIIWDQVEAFHPSGLNIFLGVDNNVTSLKQAEIQNALKFQKSSRLLKVSMAEI